jgi:hypothetical protein
VRLGVQLAIFDGQTRLPSLELAADRETVRAATNYTAPSTSARN